VRLLIRWRRQWQPKQYEAEEVTLELGWDAALPGEAKMTAAQVGENAALMEREALAELTKIGDAAMAERLRAPDPRTPPPVPKQQGWTR